MKIRFLIDYRGVLTGEIFYLAGTEVDGIARADKLIADGRAELVEDDQEPDGEDGESPAPAKPRRARKAKGG